MAHKSFKLKLKKKVNLVCPTMIEDLPCETLKEGRGEHFLYQPLKLIVKWTKGNGKPPDD